MTAKTQLQVEAIRNGTVIDHIPAGQALKILKLFHFLDTHQAITVGFNLPSKAFGHKDLIKIENASLTEDQANQLAIFAPDATVNIIQELKVIEKRKLCLPERIKHIVSCPNSNCITHADATAVSNFQVLNQNGRIRLKCRFCEKVFDKSIVASYK